MRKLKYKQSNTLLGSASLLKAGVVWAVLALLLVLLAIVSVAIGSAGYSLSQVVDALLGKDTGTVRTVLISLRLPRVVLAILIGACLAASGALLQAVMRNPLADPGSIGVSAGAGTAAITILLLYPHLALSVPLFAFLGAACACVIIYVAAWKGGVDPTRIILSGVAVNSVLGGYNSLLQLMNSDNLEGVLAFLNGSLSGCSWASVRTMVFYAVIGLFLSLLCIRNANALQLGDEMCTNLGIRSSMSRVSLSAVSAFLAASTVSVVGMISFAGLVVPHLSRMLVGSDYKVMLPTCILLGGVVLLLADTVGRCIVPGMEIPVGVVMSITGGPFFLLMLRKRGQFNGG